VQTLANLLEQLWEARSAQSKELEKAPLLATLSVKRKGQRMWGQWWGLMKELCSEQLRGHLLVLWFEVQMEKGFALHVSVPRLVAKLVQH